MNNNEILNTSKDRFTFVYSGSNIIFDEQQFDNNNIQEYLQKRNVDLLTCTKKFTLGDLVILKHTNQIVKIVQVDHKYNNQKIADYVGFLIKNNEEQYIIFNQEDIKNEYTMQSYANKKNKL